MLHNKRTKDIAILKKKRHKADDHITNTVKEINRW